MTTTTCENVPVNAIELDDCALDTVSGGVCLPEPPNPSLRMPEPPIHKF